MPMYEYSCKKCNKYQTRLVKIGHPNPPCQDCDGELNKLLSAPAGSGNSAHGFMGQTGKVKRE